MEIRLAQPDDAPRLSEIIREAFEVYVSRLGTLPRPMQFDVAAAIPTGQIWAVATGPELIGVVELRPEPEHLYVDNLAVAPQSQGQGVGALVMSFAEERAVSLGLSEIRLYTHELMTENIAFYKRLNYTLLPREPLDPLPRVQFRKRVPTRH